MMSYELALIPQNIDTKDIGNIEWQTKEGELIRLRNIPDSHLRNIALMLMGFGYQEYNATNEIKIEWLKVMRMEWERRKLRKAFGKH